MMLFDWPEHLVSIGQRPSTTDRLRMFINSPQGRSYAIALAKRVESSDQTQSIQQAYSLAFGRQPSNSELQAATAFLQQQMQAHQPALATPNLPSSRWPTYVRR